MKNFLTKGEKCGILCGMIGSTLRDEGFVEVPGWRGPSGVYLLLRGEEVLYAGQAKNVYQRLTSHYNTKRRGGPSPSAEFVTDVTRAQAIPFDRVLVRFCAEADLDRQEIALIDRFQPPYNTANRQTGEARIRVNIADLADKLGFHHWKHKPREEIRRRRVG